MKLVAPGSLPNDGKVIADERPSAESASALRGNDGRTRCKPGTARIVERRRYGWALAEGKTAGRSPGRAPSAASGGRASPTSRSISPASAASRFMSRRNSCCRRAPARRSPRSRSWSPKAIRSSPSNPPITGRCLAGRRARAASAACSPPICRGRAAIKAGAARDHFLGVTAVSGRGETFKSGGRVVKNVTGYDLCKVLAGSFGTLAAMTDVTIKTLPRSRDRGRPLIVTGLDDAKAAARDGRARWDRPATCPAPRICPRMWRARFEALPSAGDVTALRIEGVAPSVAHRTRRARALCSSRSARCAVGADERSRALWREHPRREAVRGDRRCVRSAALADFDRARHAAARSPTSSRSARRCSMTGAAVCSGWPCRPPTTPAPTRSAAPCSATGGHATLVRAPHAMRAKRRCVPAAGRGACGLDQAGEGQLRSARAFSIPAACGRAFNHANQFLARAARRSRISRNPTRSCAPACIAASAPRPVRPMCCSAMSSIARAAASI